jgi:glycosyltransferase involved in cell wall biosynthesis
VSQRVLVAGHWDDGPGYPRAEQLLAGLSYCGFEVEECRVPAPARGMSKVALAARPWRWPGYWLHTRSTRRRLQAALGRRIAEGGIDVVLVPYPGHLAVRWVREVWRGPLILDLFLSAYGTIVLDRDLFRAGSIPARLIAGLDRRACEAADLVLLDTPEHAALVARDTELPAERFDWVPIGDDVSAVHPTTAPRSVDGSLSVLFFGTGVPLHGLRTWIDAIAATPSVRLELYGGSEGDRRQARAVLGSRLVLHPRFVPMSELRGALDRAQVVAGIMGTSPKAEAVIPFKVVHALAHGRCVVTADTPAIRRVLTADHDAVLVRAGDRAALTAALESLSRDPSRVLSIGERARTAWLEHASPRAIGDRLAAVVATRLGLEVARTIDDGVKSNRTALRVCS